MSISLSKLANKKVKYGVRKSQFRNHFQKFPLTLFSSKNFVKVALTKELPKEMISRIFSREMILRMYVNSE